MVEEKILTQDQGHMVQQLQEQAVSEHFPFLVFLRNPNSVSKYLFFSVYAERRRYWSKLKRTIVTFDTVKKTLSCRCSSGKRTCAHKTAIKWYLFQEHKDMLTSELTDLSDEENDSENVRLTQEVTQNEKRKLDYIQRHKRYPVTKSIDIPHLNDITEIIPSEKTCVQCRDKLTRVVLVNRHGKAVLKNKVIHDISVYNKVCSKCGMEYRYQEWSDGLHNYDDSTFIGFDACHLIRAGLQNHVAISRTINMLADTLDENLRLHDLTNAYLMFEALTEHSYSFYCYLCGFYPTTIVMDGIRKTCFRHAVSDMVAPADFTELPETVDMDSFWKKVEQELISPGVRHGKHFPLLIIFVDETHY
ncbi:uncharacterized protein LOC127739070 [Mytilus californianus]|uniref:uncharacterized protein LOC127739070 n=1 Tax=Mytilus californianus TaxID=6549 RepID=UPI00224620A1|nr:uncharacterized protein LOC127739070 [Mytilus californianus]